MEKLLTIREAAARCGVSARQVYKLAASGGFGPEFIRVGGSRSVRFRESELDAWLRGGCVPRERWVQIRDGALAPS